MESLSNHDPTLSPYVITRLVRVIQSGVTNTLRHARMKCLKMDSGFSPE